MFRAYGLLVPVWDHSGRPPRTSSSPLKPAHDSVEKYGDPTGRLNGPDLHKYLFPG
ncbi:hypothetical protein F4553_000013 [Allocatelliglobosispora scoriae]|uniref:Uncharacterized protein n=1 Tax=Allocatelliglobosispora scoriae TaxID=643052 RepID=A0A841BEC0_9ACTN|nr:hypothetical protein [Allocatelliglobosispora scoriae]